MNLRPKIKLLRGLLSGDYAYNIPAYVTVRITRRCNLHCVGCFRHLKSESPVDQNSMDFPLPLFAKLCDDLKNMGTREMTIVGDGEPFMHPQLFEMIAMAKQAGMHLKVITNGTLISDELIPLLAQSGLDVLRVSLWGADLQVFRQNNSGIDGGHFANIIDSLKSINAYKKQQKCNYPKVILHQPLNRYNFAKIEQFVSLAHDVGADGISFSPFKLKFLFPKRTNTL